MRSKERFVSTTKRIVLNLPSHLVANLRESVRSGAFPTESAAIEELLLAWYGPEGTEEPPIEVLRAIIAEGIAEVDAGRGIDADAAFNELAQRYQSIPKR